MSLCDASGDQDTGPGEVQPLKGQEHDSYPQGAMQQKESLSPDAASDCLLAGQVQLPPGKREGSHHQFLY